MNSSTLKLEDYGRGFIGLYGFIVAIVTALPLGNFIDPVSGLFPPLWESVQSVAIIGAVAFSVMIIFAVYFAKDSVLSRSKGTRFFIMLACLLIAGVCFGWHLLERANCVRILHRTGLNTELKSSVAVSVGDVRSQDPRLVEAYRDKSDSEMLQSYGATDEDILKLFTRDSVNKCRMLLYLSFLLCAVGLVAFGSFGALFVALDTVAGERPGQA